MLTSPYYARPKTIAEALAAKQDHPNARWLAGGTDMMVAQQRSGIVMDAIDIFGLPQLCDISMISSTVQHMRIGAAVTYRQLIASADVTQHAPALVAAARDIGAWQIQQRGTLGGNIGTSSPVGDTLPVLLALDAQIELQSVASTRVVPYRDFCTGYRQTCAAPDELITAILIPIALRPVVQFWRKAATRRAQAISKVMIAAQAQLDGTQINSARVAFGAVADRPIRICDVERLLSGQKPSIELAMQARAVLRDAISPIDDLRSTAAYRARVAENLLAQFVEQLSEQIA